VIHVLESEEREEIELLIKTPPPCIEFEYLSMLPGVIFTTDEQSITLKVTP
jgi:hypothetical protein